MSDDPVEVLQCDIDAGVQFFEALGFPQWACLLRRSLVLGQDGLAIKALEIIARHRIAAHPGTRELREALEMIANFPPAMTETGKPLDLSTLPCQQIARAALQSPSPMDDERAQIVAWLRAEMETYHPNYDVVRAAYRTTADAIERGDHLATIRGEPK